MDNEIDNLPVIDSQGLWPYVGKEIRAREMDMMSRYFSALSEEERKEGLKGVLFHESIIGFCVDVEGFGKYAMIPSRASWVLGLPDSEGNFEDHLYVDRKP